MKYDKLEYGVRKDDSIWVSFTNKAGAHLQFDWYGDEETLKWIQRKLEDSTNLDKVPDKCYWIDGSSGCHNSCCNLDEEPCPLEVNCFNVGAKKHKPVAPRGLYQEMEKLCATLVEGEKAGRWPEGTSVVVSCFHTKLLEFKPKSDTADRMIELAMEANGSNCYIHISPPQTYPSRSLNPYPGIKDENWNIMINFPDCEHEERIGKTFDEAADKVREMFTEMRTKKFAENN
jgi:hypothetical protein